MKHNNFNISVIKAFKTWVRKGSHNEFLTEYAGAVKFAGESPAIPIQLPLCIQQSLVEMKFTHGLLDDLKEKNASSVKSRFISISKEKCQGLFVVAELEAWQLDLRGA